MWPRRRPTRRCPVAAHIRRTPPAQEQTATDLGLRAEAVGTDIDARRLGLTKFENSYGIYDPDFLPEFEFEFEPVTFDFEDWDL